MDQHVFFNELYLDFQLFLILGKIRFAFWAHFGQQFWAPFWATLLGAILGNAFEKRFLELGEASQRRTFS
jgi:glycerol uptake facilitator-like aquaporin